MSRYLNCAAAVIVLLFATEAFARGAASSVMNSPGYQRRLQESRGYVPNRSGSILATQPTGISKGRRSRHRY